MAKNLLIVESPAKTRTLKKFLGREYAVEASVGHIRDLVKKDMGIGPNYEPHYAVLANKREIVKKLREAAKKAQTVYLAPDPDREGEAIAWHISEVLGKEPESVRRVTFNEITRRAVLQALEQPGDIDYKKVDAQQARRVLDRLMGFRLSPLLWEKVKQGLSAGRVQSVALKMVCDRQAEIEAFQPQEYWNLAAELAAGAPPPFIARLHRIDGKKAEVGGGEQAAAIVRDLEGGSFVVHSVERKEAQQKPGAPFITSRLQQEAAKRFGFSVKRTMALAQGLYEGREIGDRGAVGLITYMRTDSTRVSDEALAAVRDLIAATYGAELVPETANRYASKKGAQDAHEAIRPTTFELPPDAVKDYLKVDEWKLYKLIWERFIGSQMVPALFDVTQVDVASGRYTLRAAGRVLKRLGFLAVYRETPDEEAGGAAAASAGNGNGGSGDELAGGSPADAALQAPAALPPLREGEVLELRRVVSEQKFTQPPAQYSEATLVKALEENGIGRPSTYATILATLSERDYAERVEGRFRPSALGRLVNGMLQSGFHDILNEGYTAALEGQLDEIEEGQLDWRQAVANFDEKFSQDLETAGEQIPNVKREGVPLDEKCPECGSQLVMRFGRYGTFVGCSTYPECKYTRDLEPAGAAGTAGSPASSANGGGAPAAAGGPGDAGASGAGQAGGAAAEEIPPCEECGRPMALRRSRFGTFYGCTGYPECKGLRKIGPKAEPPKPTGVACPECGKGEIEEKRSRRGKLFYSCNRYPECKFALWNRPVQKPCPDCGAPFLLEKTTKRTGTRLVCNAEGCTYSEDTSKGTSPAGPPSSEASKGTSPAGPPSSGSQDRDLQARQE
ncbi:MAG: type I DNA topoisomerase [Acidobacteria bacterium]|nr:type I DNA topoisomerase [Acidobacteriota bacterium]